MPDPSFGVYIHWPFCESKCPYCDFNSHVRDGIAQEGWRDAYLTELDAAALEFGKRPVDTVFFGGGTPSLMDPATVAVILEGIDAMFSFADAAEVTLEANPSSAELKKFRALRDAGVNRLSLGVQSLDDDALRFLGRTHDAVTARTALSVAAETFPRVSFDLIYALPGQSRSAWRGELAEALSLGTGHLSAYQLTLETGTPFFHAAQAGKLMLPGNDAAAALYDLTQELCDAAGLPAYEVSNHARPGEQSCHNLLYWRSRDWAGVGPGAHGRRTSILGRAATTQLRSPEAWIAAVNANGSGRESEDLLDATQICEEALLMGLRLTEGIDDARFCALTGRSIEECFGAGLVELADAGLLVWDGIVLSATPAGRLVLGRVVETLASVADANAPATPP